MELSKLLVTISDETFPQLKDSPYECSGRKLPRVTEILSSMLHEEFLMRWANSLGFKRQSYATARDLAADKGSCVHNAIEDYLSNNVEFDPDSIENYTLRLAATNGYRSFLKWWNEINSVNKVNIIMQEEKLLCDFFGGTLDLLLDINGKIVLVDFKTSNHLSYKYVLQLAAYRYMLRLRGIEVDICCIIKLDKECIDYEELVIDTADYQDLDLLNHAEETFLSLVFAYIQRSRIEQEYKQKISRAKE